MGQLFRPYEFVHMNRVMGVLRFISHCYLIVGKVQVLKCSKDPVINNCTIYETPTNVGPSPSGTLVFDSFNDQAALTLNNSGDAFVKGKLGIGTETTGSHELAVEGSIGAREIKVEASGWSDFVFENDYELRTLEEVEQHINENGHLPEIPSEAEGR